MKVITCYVVHGSNPNNSFVHHYETPSEDEALGAFARMFLARQHHNITMERKFSMVNEAAPPPPPQRDPDPPVDDSQPRGSGAAASDSDSSEGERRPNWYPNM